MSDHTPETTGASIHALALNVIDRATGQVEAQMKFFPSEVAMPGYVESVERGYVDTAWRTERVTLLPDATDATDATDAATSPHVRFVRNWQAWPHTRMNGDADALSIEVRLPGNTGDHIDYEFSLVHEGTERTARQPIGLRVQIFDDAWRAFGDLPDFFALLARLHTEHAAPDLSLDEIVPLLCDLGWHDETPRRVAEHRHTVGCLTCGARVGDPGFEDHTHA